MQAVAWERWRLRASIIFALSAAMLACGLAQARAAVPAPAPADDGVRAVCPPEAHKGARCRALELTAPEARPATGSAGRPLAVAGAAQTPECHVPLASQGCYGLRPQDLHSAYELPQTPVAPQTVAVISAGGDPTIKKDLANYDREFGLEGCPGETACPAIVNGEGTRHLPAVEGNAPLETSLDVEVAHAVCPGCNLLLVEASSASLPAFEEATDTAVRLGAEEISISWGEPEPAQINESGAAFDHPGVVITAAAGDTGYLNWASPEAERGRPEYPASSPAVIAVGGTSLELGPAGEWQGEQVWDQLEPDDEGGGSGCSALFAAPSWQLELPGWEAVGCASHRATADIAAIADPRLGVAVYDSTEDSEGHKPGWRRLGGTSVGAPLLAGAFALAGGAHGVAYPAQSLYRNAALDPGLLHDVTSGTNGACEQTLGRGCTFEEQAADCAARPICVAGPGYDGPTGLGSPQGIGALEPRLAFQTLPPSPARRGASFPVEATVEATGQPVAVASATPSVCMLEGATAVMLAAGTCTLTAAQPGYLEALQSFTVARTLQQVSFSSAAPAAALAGGPGYVPAASASSGLAVTFRSLTPSVCALKGDAVSPLAAGVCAIAAEQAGDGDFEPAPAATQSYTVGPPAPTIGVLSFQQGPTPIVGATALRLRSSPVSSRRDGAITLSLAAARAGALRWRLTFTRSGRCPAQVSPCPRQIVSFAAGSRAVGPGRLTLALHPARAAIRALRARQVLRVQVLLTLTPSSGPPVRVHAAVLVRLASSR